MAGCTPAVTPLGHRGLPVVAAATPGAYPRVVQLAAGAQHTCALRSDARVLCWGSNAFGQIAPGGPRVVWTPTITGVVDDAFQIAAASGVTCARRRQGSVRCWGTARIGHPLPAGDVPALAGAVDVAVGFAEVCAVLRGGAVACASLRDDGSPARRIPLDGRALQVAAGDRHACAVTEGGDVDCWGSNRHAELATTDLEESQAPIAVGAVHRAVQIAASLHRTCAWEEDGEVGCWGDLGPVERADPFWLPDSDGLAGLAATRARACGWFASGEVRCIERGTGLLPAIETMRDLGHVVQVVAGLDHFCALDRDGNVSCWGDDGHAQLGLADDAKTAPRFVAGIDDAIDLAAGSEWACAARASGVVACWGAPPFAPGPMTPHALAGVAGAQRLAVDAAGNQLYWLDSARRAHRVVGPGESVPDDGEGARLAALGPVRELAVGDDHLCAIGDDSRVRCMGANGDGQLGSAAVSPGPALVPGVEGAASVVARGPTTCASTAAGMVTCWGGRARAAADATEGPATATITSVLSGDGDDDTYSVGFSVELTGPLALPDEGFGAVLAPHAMPDLSGVDRLARAHDRLCGILQSGAVMCWHEGHAAQPMTDLTSANALSGSDDHSCALLSGGRAVCWGYGDAGQLGGGTFVREGRAEVALAHIDQIAAGERFTCARLGGKVACWGEDRYGELGDGHLAVLSSDRARRVVIRER
jgi:alpha-tubulin suppressor-like RCC1 family protein